MSLDFETTLKKLLQHSLDLFAAKLELHSVSEVISLEEIVLLLNEADKLSYELDKKHQIKAVVICALVAEILPKEAVAVAAFISRILIRIGLTPTAKMLQTNLKYIANDEKFFFSDLGSYIDNLTSQIHITSHEIKINNTTLKLTKFQKQMWDAINQHTYVGISAPTSAGKSFLLVAKIIEALSKSDGTVVFIVPTISLVNQVSRDIALAAKDYDVEGIKLLKSFARNVSLNNTNKKTVYVVTQERAASYFSRLDNKINLTLPITLIVDEIQNIEQTTEDQNTERAMVLLDVIHRFLADTKPEKFIISGPRLKNLESVLETWVESTDRKCESDTLPTVINVCYTFKKESIRGSKRIIISQYVEEMPVTTLQIDDNFNLSSSILGKAMYKDPAIHNFLGHISHCLEKDGGSLIFSKSSQQAFRTAMALTDYEKYESDKLQSLIEYSHETVHDKYGLGSCLAKGIAYHHGKVPHHIRIPIEKAFSQGLIKKLVCTTTLMQGVNLPAKNILIRNPDISTKKLSSYEFANLRGRAGRLMKDFVGRSILIDELSFSDEEIEMQSSSTKDLDFTYGSKFKKNRREIMDILVDLKEKTNDTPAADLAIYIEQVLFKNSLHEALEKLRKLGIFLTLNEAQKIKHMQTYLDIPKEIVFSNPFWSPKDLQTLYDMNNENEIAKLPNSPFQNLKDTLVGVNTKMRDTFPFYFKKYVNITHDGKLSSVCSLAQEWAKGTPLKTLIDSWQVDSSEDVEKRIGDITNKIPYGITKLIKPIIDIQSQDEDNSIITFLETGCFDAEQRTLLSLGLAREVVLRTNPGTNTHSQDEPVDVDKLLLNLSKQKTQQTLQAGIDYKLTKL